MKKIYLLKLFFFIFFFTISNSYSSNQTKIIASVGNEIISSYELKNKINTILFLSNQQVNQMNINNIKNQALRTLVNSRLKKIEINKYNISIEKDQNVKSYLARAASRFNATEEGLKKIFLKNNIDFDIYEKEIMIDLAWQKLIFNLYNDKITLDENEINNELDRIVKEQKKIKEYELAEIEIILDEGSNIDNKIKEISDEIRKNGFENTAIKFSSSSSAFDGGKLGWINSNALSEDISKILKDIKAGEVTEPVVRTNNVLFFKLLNERSIKIQDIDIKNTKQKIISNKKNELFTLYSNSRLSKIKNNTLIKIQ